MRQRFRDEECEWAKKMKARVALLERALELLGAYIQGNKWCPPALYHRHKGCKPPCHKCWSDWALAEAERQAKESEPDGR